MSEVQRDLFEAIRNRDRVGVIAALRAGAPIDSEFDGYTPLGEAIQNEYPDIALCLVGAGSDVNLLISGDASPLLLAAFRDNMEIARMLVSHGANTEPADGEGHFPLKVAAENGNDSMVTLLLDAGARINRFDGVDGMTVLGKAAVEGHVSTVELLLSRGANPDFRDLDYSSPLELMSSIAIGWANQSQEGRERWDAIVALLNKAIG